MNTIMVTGNIGKDAVVKEKDGRKYILFRMATTTMRGETKKTTWRSVFCYHSEGLLSRLVKGAAVLVIGDEEISLHNTKVGTEIDVVVNAYKVQVLSDAQQAKTPEPPVAKNEQLFDNNNDEMPF